MQKDHEQLTNLQEMKEIYVLREKQEILLFSHKCSFHFASNEQMSLTERERERERLGVYMALLLFLLFFFFRKNYSFMWNGCVTILFFVSSSSSVDMAFFILLLHFFFLFFLLKMIQNPVKPALKELQLKLQKKEQFTVY